MPYSKQNSKQSSSINSLRAAVLVAAVRANNDWYQARHEGGDEDCDKGHYHKYETEGPVPGCFTGSS